MRPFPMLDGYRALAALMVLTTHVAYSTGALFTPVLGPVLGRMDFGVTLFFLLSGFLLYRPWSRAAMLGAAGPGLGGYALRRSARILPAYWAMVVFTLLILPEIQPVTWEAWPIHLGLLHIYIPGYTLEGLTQTWSLATEVAFYAALPLIAWLAGRRGHGSPDRSARYQLTILTCGVVAANAFSALVAAGALGTSTLTYLWLPGFLDWFALGMAAAVIQTRLALPQPPRWMLSVKAVALATGWCLTIALALAVIASTPVAGPLTLELTAPSSYLIKHALYGVIAAFLLLPALLGIGDAQHTRTSASWWGKAMTSGPVVFLGTISYGIFLWHLVLMRLILQATGLGIFQGGFLILWPLVVMASVAVATASWFLLERPIQAWAHASTTDRQASPRPPRLQPPPAKHL